MKAHFAIVALVALTVAGCSGGQTSKAPAPTAPQAQAPAQQGPSSSGSPLQGVTPGAGGETPAPQTSPPAQPSQAASPLAQQQPGAEGTQPASQGVLAETPSPQPTSQPATQAAPGGTPQGALPTAPAQPQATAPTGAQPQPGVQPKTPAPSSPPTARAPSQPQTQSAGQPPATSAAPPSPAPTGPENLLSWDRGAIVRIWPVDTDPQAPVSSPVLTRPLRPWLSKRGTSGPYTFVFELSAEATIERFGFRAGSDSSTRARVVHVAVSTQSADAGFTDAGTFTLRDDNNEQEFPLSPSRAARWIRVTIDQRPQGQVSLGRVLAYGKESIPAAPASLVGTWVFDEYVRSAEDPLFGPSGRLPTSMPRYQKAPSGGLSINGGPNGKVFLVQAIQNGDSVSGVTCAAGGFAYAGHWQVVRSGRVFHVKNFNGSWDGSAVVNAEGTLLVGAFHVQRYPFVAMRVSDDCLGLLSPPRGSGKKVLVLYGGARGPGHKSYPPFDHFTDYPGYRFVVVWPTLLQASDLAEADSAVLAGVSLGGGGCDVTHSLTDWQKDALLNFVKSGHKLIIHDADGCSGKGSYNLLPYPFTTDNPGAMGAGGKLILVDPSALGTDDRHDAAHFVDVPAYGATPGQQLGDADVVTSQDAHWCGHLFGTNVHHVNGFVHMYARYGSGLIIYNGLDGDNYDLPEYKRLAQLELTLPPSTALPCTQSVAAKFLVAPSQTVPFVPGQAQSIPAHLEVLPNLGYTGTVSLSATPPESTGWDTHLSTAQVTLTKDTDSAPVDVTIGVPATATRHTYTVTVTGSDGAGHTASAVITLVAGAPAPAPVVKTPPKNVEVTEERCRIRITVASGILFDFDKDNLKPGAEAVLAEAKASIIDKHPGARLIVEGHTDDRGTQEYNLKLSARRAQSVAGWLSRHGIPTSTLATKGYGKIKPRYANTTGENRARNRRVEIIVVTCPGP